MAPFGASPMATSTISSLGGDSLEVDYDKNITQLYDAILRQQWEVALTTAEQRPREARTWVVRHVPSSSGVAKEVMWRFLPLHSACARQPPAQVIAALLRAYPQGARCMDDQGMYPLHYACGNQASREVIRLLLGAFAGAVKMVDPRGMTPLHFLACWGPSHPSVIDLVLLSHREVVNWTDEEGNTPWQLASEGEYNDRDKVMDTLQKWLATIPMNNNNPNDHNGAFSGSNMREEPSRPFMSLNNQSSHAGQNNIGAKEMAAMKGAFGKGPPRPPSRVSSPVQGVSPNPQMQGSIINNSAIPSSPKTSAQQKEAEDMINRLKAELAKVKADADFEKVTLEERLSSQAAQHQAEKESWAAEKQELQRDLGMTRESMRKTMQERDDYLRVFQEEQKKHGEVVQKTNGMNERLKGLSASLHNLMIEQQHIMATVQQQEEGRVKMSMERRAMLQEFLELESQDHKNSEEDTFEMFDRQQKEMAAIASVIAAVRI